MSTSALFPCVQTSTTTETEETIQVGLYRFEGSWCLGWKTLALVVVLSHVVGKLCSKISLCMVLWRIRQHMQPHLMFKQQSLQGINHSITSQYSTPHSLTLGQGVTITLP